MIKLLTIIGARPQIIKAAAISRAIVKHYKSQINEIIVHTGQHYDNNMSNVFFEELNIPQPDYNLGVGSGLHGRQTARMIEGVEDLLLEVKPDYIILYGDTNSTLAGAIAASKLHVPVVHVEAGLRSFNRKMPEEVNRITCDHLSTLMFSPTKTGVQNLIHEGFDGKTVAPFTPDNPGIFHCGDVMFDNSLYFSEIAQKKSCILSRYGLEENQYILATLHRDHNTDNPVNMGNIFKAFLSIAENHHIILPLHPRTKAKLDSGLHTALAKDVKRSENLRIIEPVSFLDMIQLERNAKLIMTDSGGVQKESYFFNKPCIILRPETEWVEVLETGKAELTQANRNKIEKAFNRLINTPKTNFPKLFGDGHAAEFICKTIINNT